MPLPPFRVDCARAGQHIIVPSGNRINGVSILEAPSGVLYFVKLGNNDRFGPITGKLTLTFGGDEESSDVQEGFIIELDTAVPGAFIRGFTSSSKVRK